MYIPSRIGYSELPPMRNLTWTFFRLCDGVEERFRACDRSAFKQEKELGYSRILCTTSAQHTVLDVVRTSKCSLDSELSTLAGLRLHIFPLGSDV